MDATMGKRYEVEQLKEELIECKNAIRKLKKDLIAKDQYFHYYCLRMSEKKLNMCSICHNLYPNPEK